MKRLVFITFLITAVMFSVPAVSFANIFDGVIKAIKDTGEELEEGAIVGVGVLYSTEPYTDVDEDFDPIPLIIARYKNFFVDGRVFGYYLYEDEKNNLDFSIIGKPRFDGYEAEDSPALNGMEDRDASLDGGARLSWENDIVDIDITAVTDLTNNHQGQEYQITFSKELFRGFLTPRVGVNILSEDLVDYYYGVQGSEALQSRAPYEGDTAVNFVAGATVAVPFGDNWAVVGDFEYENLPNEISDSSIVDVDETLTFVTGVVYRF